MTATHARVTKFLRRLQNALRNEQVLVTRKAIEEALDELDFDRAQVLELLAGLARVDFEACVPNSAVPGDTVWIFCPQFDDVVLWVRLVERRGIIVVSFHEA